MTVETLEARRLLSAVTLRVVSYNIEADVDGVTTPRDGIDAVLRGIGEESIGGVARPLDILALTETTSNTATIAPIVSALNTIYGPDVYAMSSYQGTEAFGDPTTGNGPSGLIYNTATLTLLSSVGVGTPEGSTNGEYRQVIRYEFQPVGGTSANDFYLYLSHYKSGVSTVDQQDRAGEAASIRADEATLPASARVIYAGDFNYSDVTSGQFTTLTAPGQGQAIDPTNPSDTPRIDPLDLLSESATYLDYRDDYQMMTSNIYNGTTGGLVYVPGSFQAFGNDGSTPMYGSVDAATNTALAGLGDQSTVLAALTTASDHLPVVADYTDPLATTGSISGHVQIGSSRQAGVTVYLDVNNNHQLDPGELSTVTNSDGDYTFNNVPPDYYIVRQVEPADSVQVTPVNNLGVHLTLAAGQSLGNKNFLNEVAASISGTAFNDVNGDGVKDAKEAGLAGLTVYLDLGNTVSEVAGDPTTTTNAEGDYTFGDLAAGNYIVRVKRPAGVKQTSPLKSYGQHVSVTTITQLVNVDFGEQAIS